MTCRPDPDTIPQYTYLSPRAPCWGDSIKLCLWYPETPPVSPVIRHVLQPLCLLSIARNLYLLIATHSYLQDLGARHVPTKSYNFASSTTAKKCLGDTWCPTINVDIAVAGDFRYLGVHLSTNLTKKYTTLEDRIARALAQLIKLRFVQATLLSKAKAIRVKIYVQDCSTG